MKHLLLIILFLASSVFAEDQKYILKTEPLKNGTKKVHVDINQDGKVDRIETYKGEQLISVENDTKKMERLMNGSVIPHTRQLINQFK